MAKTTIKDMTTGSPMKLVTGFLIPLLGGLLFQQLYNMVDTVIVGKFLGIDALAGVGSTGSINFLVLGFCMGICSGFAIPVAQKFGEHDDAGLRRFVANAAWLSAVLAAVITVTVCLLCGRILHWMKTPANIFDNAYTYIFIIFLGIPVTILYNLLSGIMRSLGDSKTPIFFLVLSSLLNVALDLLSVTLLGMGVEGPALATVISQAVSGVLCLFVMGKRYEILRFSREEWKPSRSHLARLASMGIPMGLQYSITAIGSIILQSSVNTLGSVYVASVTAGSKVVQLLACTFDAMGTTMAVYGGQNYGAMKLERIHKGVGACVLLAAFYSAVAFVFAWFCGKDIASFFIDSTEPAETRTTIANFARSFLVGNVAFFMPLALVNILRFTIQGLGFTNQAVIAGVLEMIARGVVGLMLVPKLGYDVVCFANPTAWIMADLFLVPIYFRDVGQLKKQYTLNPQKS
ncbi:MAG: MATE family efflux transporter [Faecousia sp.]